MTVSLILIFAVGLVSGIACFVLFQVWKLLRHLRAEAEKPAPELPLTGNCRIGFNREDHAVIFHMPDVMGREVGMDPASAREIGRAIITAADEAEKTESFRVQ